MNTTVIWVILAGLFCVIEGMTVALVSVWMAIAAVITAVIAYFGGSILVQILSFLLLSAILILATIPLSKKFYNKKMEKTNADRVIDAEAVVIERIDSIDNRGKIKVLGQIWSASCKNSVTIDIGEKVVIRSIEGVRAIVEKL